MCVCVCVCVCVCSFVMDFFSELVWGKKRQRPPKRTLNFERKVNVARRINEVHGVCWHLHLLAGSRPLRAGYGGGEGINNSKGWSHMKSKHQKNEQEKKKEKKKKKKKRDNGGGEGIQNGRSGFTLCLPT